MKYFIHDTNAFQDEKVTRLFMEYGFEGIGLFFTIIEKLAMQEKPVITSVLKKQLFVGKRLEKCWLFMEEIDLISSNNGETFNKQLLNFSEKFQIKKEKNRKRISEWREKQLDTENVTCYESVRNTLKDKINKDKIIKEDIKEIFNVFRMQYLGSRGGLDIEVKNFLKSNNPNDVELLLPALLHEIEYKKKLKQSGLFCPEWKNLKTWINQKCWLQELPEIKPTITISKEPYRIQDLKFTQKAN